MTSGNERGRVFLRATLAAVVAVDLVSFYGFLAAARAAAAARGIVPDAFTALISMPVVSAIVIVLGVTGAVAFAYRPGRLWEGALALGALALLSSAHAQLFGSPWRHLFYSGLCLAGWLVGLAVSRRLETPTDESYACTGATALLGAAYCNAGISKLVYGGFDWVSAVPIQSVVVGQDGLVADSAISAYRAWVVNTPLAGIAFSIGTVVFELAGPLMVVGPRIRLLVTAGLFAMHANIFVLTGILYWESMLLLALFALTPQSDAAPAPEPTPSRSDRRYWAAVAILVLCAGLAVAHQARRYAEHATHGEPVPPAAQAPTPALREIGPFAVGQTLAQTWSIAALDVSAEGFVVAVARAGAQARFEFTCASSPHRSPFDLGAAHIFYSSDRDFGELEPIGQELQARLRDAAGNDDVCARLRAWRASARPAPAS
jgi:hypothetical protein